MTKRKLDTLERVIKYADEVFDNASTEVTKKKFWRSVVQFKYGKKYEGFKARKPRLVKALSARGNTFVDPITVVETTLGVSRVDGKEFYVSPKVLPYNVQEGLLVLNESGVPLKNIAQIVKIAI